MEKLAKRLTVKKILLLYLLKKNTIFKAYTSIQKSKKLMICQHRLYRYHSSTIKNGFKSQL